MPALTTLVLKDRATTPVDHTFTPSEVKDGIGTVVESTGMKLGDSKYSVSSRKTAGGRYAGKLKLEVPVVENQTVNGVTRPVVTRVGYARLTLASQLSLPLSSATILLACSQIHSPRARLSSTRRSSTSKACGADFRQRRSSVSS